MSLELTVIHSIVVKGDISLLNDQQKTEYYLYLCRRFRLDPHLRPFDSLRLNNKEILYANRGATDGIARNEGIQRVTVTKPHALELYGVKLVSCTARATGKDGRWEERVATIMFRDAANDLMKAETKAHRRATLALVGAGIIDESELDTIPGADSLAEPSRQYALNACLHRALESVNATPELQALDTRNPVTVEAWKAQVTAFAVEASIPLSEANGLLWRTVKKARQG